MADWQEWVNEATKLGYEKVTIIARHSYQPIGCTQETLYDLTGRPYGIKSHIAEAYTFNYDELRRAEKIMAYMARKYMNDIKDLKNIIREKYKKLYCFMNENQELLDDWMNCQRHKFHFYRREFEIIKKNWMNGDMTRQYIVCATRLKNYYCIAAQFKTIWYIAAFHSQRFMGLWKDIDEAVNEINTNIFKELQEYHA